MAPQVYIVQPDDSTFRVLAVKPFLTGCTALRHCRPLYMIYGQRSVSELVN
jgi:hypothetical protein